MALIGQGTGINFGIMASHVIEISVLAADGRMLTASLTKNPELFGALQCHLGALGVIGASFFNFNSLFVLVHVTLQCEPAFKLKVTTETLGFDETLDNMPKLIRSSGTVQLENHSQTKVEHFKFLWFPHTRRCTLWRADRTTDPTSPNTPVRGFFEKLINYHLLEFVLWISLYISWLVPLINKFWQWTMYESGTSERVDLSPKVFNFDCLFQQYVNEISIPVSKVPEAMRELENLIERNGFKAHFPVEVRFVRSDTIPMSTAYGRDSCYIGIIAYKPYGQVPEYKAYFDEFQKAMHKFGGRSHWAKVFEANPSILKEQYPLLDTFIKVKKDLDPNNLFQNDYLRRIFSESK